MRLALPSPETSVSVKSAETRGHTRRHVQMIRATTEFYPCPSAPTKSKPKRPDSKPSCKVEYS